MRDFVHMKEGRVIVARAQDILSRVEIILIESEGRRREDKDYFYATPDDARAMAALLWQTANDVEKGE